MQCRPASAVSGMPVQIPVHRRVQIPVVVPRMRMPPSRDATQCDANALHAMRRTRMQARTIGMIRSPPGAARAMAAGHGDAAPHACSAMLQRKMNTYKCLHADDHCTICA